MTDINISDKLTITDKKESVLRDYMKVGEEMKVNNSKLQIALANACMNPNDLCKAVDIQYQTYRRIVIGNNCKPATVGKIAKALNVSVTEIIEEE